MSLNMSSVDRNEKLHFEINSYSILQNKYHGEKLSEPVAKSLGIPANLQDIDSANCRGIKVSTIRRWSAFPEMEESDKNYALREQSMNVWVVKQGSASKLIIQHDKNFKKEKFIEIFNSAVNDTYNDKKCVTLSSGEGYYNEHKFLYTEIDKDSELGVFELFKKLLLSSVDFPHRSDPQTKEGFAEALDTLFGIANIKREIREAETERLFVTKDYNAVYDILLSDSTLPAHKGKFLEYGKRLRADGNYEQAIRFLNSEHPIHKDTHDNAQMHVFETLGDLLLQDDKEQFLEADEKRQYQSNRIELAYKLEKTNPEIAGLADKLFCDYAGCPSIGQEPPFSLKTDPFQLALQLADALYKARTCNQQPQKDTSSPKAIKKV